MSSYSLLINVKKRRRIMKKTILTFASFFMVSTTSVHATDEIKSSDPALELEVHVKGTEDQLSNVSEDFVVFIKDIALDAYASGEEYGIYPSVIIAQAVLESGGGTSKLSESPNYNLFGVKGSYEGQSARMQTKEDNGSGNLYTIETKFRKYPNIKASLGDHGRLLREGLNGFYSGTWRENAETPKEAAEFLQGRYATDTKYASKLMSLINNYNLERFDMELTDRDLAWLSSDSLDPWELPIIDNSDDLFESTLGSSRINSLLIGPAAINLELHQIINKITQKNIVDKFEPMKTKNFINNNEWGLE